MVTLLLRVGCPIMANPNTKYKTKKMMGESAFKNIKIDESITCLVCHIQCEQ